MISTPHSRRLALAIASCLFVGLAAVPAAALYNGAPGSTGTDYSANTPTLPNVGAAFGSGGGQGACTSFVLITTIPASATRRSVSILNSSTSLICVVKDDGTAAGGAAPVNATVITLAPALTSGGGGGGFWASDTFKGRLQIYGTASTNQVAAYID